MWCVYICPGLISLKDIVPEGFLISYVLTKVYTSPNTTPGLFFLSLTNKQFGLGLNLLRHLWRWALSKRLPISKHAFSLITLPRWMSSNSCFSVVMPDLHSPWRNVDMHLSAPGHQTGFTFIEVALLKQYISWDGMSNRIEGFTSLNGMGLDLKYMWHGIGANAESVPETSTPLLL